jgi:hypothetical protein
VLYTWVKHQESLPAAAAAAPRRGSYERVKEDLEANEKPK